MKRMSKLSMCVGDDEVGGLKNGCRAGRCFRGGRRCKRTGIVDGNRRCTRGVEVLRVLRAGLVLTGEKGEKSSM